MTRAQAVAAVVEAAEILAGGAGVIRGRGPEDADIYTHELEHIRHLIACIDALPPEDTAGTVEVRAVVLMAADGVNWTVFGSSEIADPTAERIAVGWASGSEVRTAIITARVRPLAVPVIQASVEDAG